MTEPNWPHLNALDTPQWKILMTWLSERQKYRVDELLADGWVLEDTVLTEQGPRALHEKQYAGHCISPTLHRNGVRFKFPIIPVANWTDEEVRDRWTADADAVLFGCDDDDE